MKKEKILAAIFLAALTAAAGLSIVVSSRASAASGEISGRVTDQAGVGIENIKVVLYELDGGGQHPYEWVPYSNTRTNGDGYYAFSGLRTNSYAIKFDSDGLDYVSEVYQDQRFLSNAQAISITDGLVTANIDAQLAPAGRIAGRLTDKNGLRIPGARVWIYNAGGPYSNMSLFLCDTDSEGNFLIKGVPGGDFIIHFLPYDNPDGYLAEWYNDKATREAADIVAVTAGNTTTNINAILSKGGQIKGRVVDSSRKGINGVRVIANGYDVEWTGETATDSAGDYTIKGLKAGNYRLEFWDNDEPGYVTEWYDNKSGPETADLISVAVESVVQNIDAQLTTTGKIGGRITEDLGCGMAGVWVNAYRVDDSSEACASAQSNGDGSYIINNLAPGQYKIFFASPIVYPEWYSDQATFANAASVTVNAGNLTPDINARLAKKPFIEVYSSSLYFVGIQDGPVTPPGTAVLTNSGSGTLLWTATPMDDWISVSPSSGIGNAVLTVGVVRTNFAPGVYSGKFIVSDPGAANGLKEVEVSLNIIEDGTNTPPFGEFDLPVDGATVASSIPVTGWALDDIGVQSVKIYRGTNETNRIYIGDAEFVDGARPDVWPIYPIYPRCTRAGWGYMLLTNFLPNGGNGPVNLLAYATDMEGQETLLGSKTIICDNANAVKPFGAIDTPAQGGIASGAYFANFGWVLTPQPNSIPIDGSSINVWVDGLPLGHPVYNNYRADIATLFPGYANSNGAVGYYYLNTTGYADGIHTIEWSATDSGGNTDGIGSRYFMIQNAVPTLGQNAAPAQVSINAKSKGGSSIGQNGESGTGGRTAEELAALPENVGSPMFVKRGLAINAPTETALPESDGLIRITVTEVTRVAVYLNENDTGESEAEMIERGKRIRNSGAASGGSHPKLRDQAATRDRSDSRLESRFSSRYEAYQLVGGELRPLPIGASFDPESGAFYWQPGPGFRGEFRFVIVDSAAKSKKTLLVTIL